MTRESTPRNEALRTLLVACHRAGIDASSVEPIRLSENAIYRLPHGVVARVSRTGQLQTAEKEIRIARWLEDSGVRAVQVIPDLDQPVEADGRAVTFWRELPSHKYGTSLEVATTLHTLHRLKPPEHFTLPPLNPFVRLAERIDRAHMFTSQDRKWLSQHLSDLETRYTELPPGLQKCVVHGDAWGGNVLLADDGRVILADFERTAFGPPEWDLISTAIKYSTFGAISRDEYVAFAETYGHDVMTWEGFPTLRDIRELRMVTMAAQIGMENAAIHDEAVSRLATIRGKSGPRPWKHWRPLS
ncbi:aminoglycoside phosphotransferase [Streptosporangium violaceochromogenes]|nr:aminoglycoside phosphotransferase [Streptosporangium violaceochromogenes]